MPTSPGPLAEVLRSLWDAVQTSVPELPDVRIAVSPRPTPTNHGPERWREDVDGTVTGLVVSTETLKAGATATLTAVLHEAAHVLCWRRGTQDTTTRGAYHNKAFLDAATEVGLHWPEGRSRVAGRGFADPELAPSTAAQYADVLHRLDEVIPHVLPLLVLPDENPSGVPARLTVQCKCADPRRFQIYPAALKRGPIVCGVCGEEFM
ncbi:MULTISPECIES: hypothetical protein [unclassified Streptomyces]|uniref:hypothetical protein n=1 Tax=unclassified Streptomyces TaxID=2593676 RepID=UPI0033C4B9DD